MAGQPGRSGGARPNTGPKPNAIKYKKQIASATDIMGRMLPEAAEATVDLATGIHMVLVYNPRTLMWEKPKSDKVVEAGLNTEMIRVYREPPDIRAIQIMFERLMGKVAQPIDITVREAIGQVIDVQSRIMRIIEEHVSDETLTIIRDDIERVAELHQGARATVGIE